MKNIIITAALCGILTSGAAGAQQTLDDQRYWEISPETEQEIVAEQIRKGTRCSTDGCYLEGALIGLLILFGGTL